MRGRAAREWISNWDGGTEWPPGKDARRNGPMDAAEGGPD